MFDYEDDNWGEVYGKIEPEGDQFWNRIKTALERTLTYHKNRYDRHINPTAYLLSDAMETLYQCLDDTGRSVYHQFVLNEIKDVLEPEGLGVKLTSQPDGFTLIVQQEDEHLLSWEPLKGQVDIPIYQQLLDMVEEKEKVEEDLLMLKEEIVSTRLWVNKPQSLLDNDMRRLYFFSLFFSKRFKRNMAQLLSDLDTEYEQLESKHRVLQREIESIQDHPLLLKALRTLNKKLYVFPKIQSLGDYQSIQGG